MCFGSRFVFLFSKVVVENKSNKSKTNLIQSIVSEFQLMSMVKNSALTHCTLTAKMGCCPSSPEERQARTRSKAISKMLKLELNRMEREVKLLLLGMPVVWYNFMKRVLL